MQKLMTCVAVSCLSLCPIATVAQGCMPSAAEQNFWDNVKSSDNPDELIEFRKQFPEGCYSRLAEIRLESKVPKIIPFTVSVHKAGGAQEIFQGGQQISNGGASYHNLIITSGLKPSATFEYRCDGAGIGLSQWISDGGTCDGAQAIQGFEVRITGALAKYYELKVECSTIEIGNRNQSGVSVVGTGQWCGVRAGAGPRWVNNLRISATRRPF